jgi:thiamine biosynthesis lipoprotein
VAVVWTSAFPAAPLNDAVAETAATRRTVAFPTQTMGTFANVAIVCADSTAAAPIAAAAHLAFYRADSLMSNWTETSEVARINREADTAPVIVHPEVATVIAEAIRVGRESDGAFDITVEPLVRAWGFLDGRPRVPSDDAAREAFDRVGMRWLDFDAATRSLRFGKKGVRIDLGGIAKGYGVDAAAEELQARRVTDALVDLSGNMLAIGHPVERDRWKIGIRDPRGGVVYFATISLRDCAVATSGIYEQFVAKDGKRYGHIMDPRTGRTADGLISVTVVAPTAMAADAWGTALFVLGPKDGKAKAREITEIAAVLVEPGDGVDVVWVEEPLREAFELEPESARSFEVRYF